MFVWYTKDFMCPLVHFLLPYWNALGRILYKEKRCILAHDSGSKVKCPHLVMAFLLTEPPGKKQGASMCLVSLPFIIKTKRFNNHLQKTPPLKNIVGSSFHPLNTSWWGLHFSTNLGRHSNRMQTIACDYRTVFNVYVWCPSGKSLPFPQSLVCGLLAT